ncbi:MAG: PA14 domain-containing protein, partial [Verrucomicrobiota bacterium]
TKPAVLTVQVDLMPGTLNRMGIGVGFTGEPNTYNATVYYVGLSVDQDGTVKEWEGVPADPQNAIGEVAWSGIDNAAFSPDDWHTLTYTINTATGKVSNVSLSGSNADYSSLHAIVNPGLTYANTRYVTPMGDAQSGNGNGNIDNFQLSAPLSITLAAAPNLFAEDAGVAASTGTVSIPEVLEADLVIALSSSDTTEATVPESVTIVAGVLAATFPIDAVNDSEADGAQVVTLTATAEGYAAGEALLTVTDSANGGSTTPAPVELGSHAATPGDSQVILAWTASTGAASYNVKRSTTSGSGYETLGTASGTGYTDVTAVNGTTYYYVITAVNAAGESAPSAEIVATPAALTDTPSFGPGTLILADRFGGNNGDSLDGRIPDGANLPGRTWQQNGGYFGRCDIQANTLNVRSMDGEAYDLSSNEAYTKPSVLIIRATLKPGTLNRMGVGAGFTDSTNTGNSTYYFSGLSLDENGTVKEWNGIPGDPQTPIRQVEWSGIDNAAFSPDDWHTLTYTVNTFTGRISNVSLSGSNADYSPLCSIYNEGVTEPRLLFTTFMGDAQSGNGNGNVDNFLLFAPTITPSADPYADWIAGFDFTAFTNPDLTATGNPSGDGLSNQLKFAYGLDPSHAEDFSNGLTREVWENFAGTRVADLTASRRFHLGPDDREQVAGVNENGMGGNYAARYRGFVTAPATGTYHFWISADDEAELWLADGTVRKTVNGQTVALTNRFGKLRIATVQDSVLDPVVFQDFDKYPSQQSRAIQLTAGQKYYFEVLHKQGGYSDHVSVAWQTPNAARQIIPASAFNADFTEAADLDSDGLPDSWELQVGLNPADNGLIDPRDGENADWDGDGISNLTEYQLGSNPKSDDSGRNLLATTYATLPPQNYVSTTDHWNRDASGSLTAVERRGEISYNFTVAAGDAGVYEIVLGGGAAGIPRPVEKLPLVFSINGNRIGAAVLTSLNGGTSSVALLTPWLPKGDYTLTILHDNYRTALQLRIDSLIIRTLAGSDVNANGRPDWLDQRLAADNRLTRIPASSLTSPLCIEGIAAQGVNRQGHTSSIPGLSLKVNDEPLTPKESIDSSFYANVPLSESAPTTVTASFQSGAVTESHEITWAPVNLRVHQVLHIRKDDSLRLDAWVDGATGPPKTFTVTMDGTLLADPAGNTTHTSGQPFTATFATAGTYTLVTNYSNRLPRTTVVHVHRANFGPDFSVRANAPREWFPPALSP